MSQPINITAASGLTPNRFTISTGITAVDITPPNQPANGYILTDLSLLPVNAAAPSGTNFIAFQIGVTLGSFFQPFLTYEALIVATAMGNFSLPNPIQRSFGSGLILQTGHVNMTVVVTDLIGITAANFTLDLSGFYY